MSQNLDYNLTFEFKGNTIILKFPTFNSEIDIDEITSIDYHNLFAEIITIPALMNRVGLWKSEADNVYGLYKLEVEVKEAELFEYYSKSLTQVYTGSTGKEQTKFPSAETVQQAVNKDPIRVNMRKKLLRLQKEADYLDSFYWSVKSKEKKLDNLTHTLTPEDMQKDLVNQKFNDILIKVKQNLI